MNCFCIFLKVFEEDDGVLTDGTRGSHEKDSGISRTTDSEPDLPPPMNSSPSKYSQSSGSSSIRSGASGTGKEISTPENAGEKSLNIASDQKLPRRSDSESSLERELHNLHREMEFIQLECDRLIEQHAKAERQVRQQMDQANKLAATMDSFQKQQLFRLDSSDKCSVSPPPIKNGLNNSKVIVRTSREETSSAYNTGNESCRSTPLNIACGNLKLLSSDRKLKSMVVDQNDYETIDDCKRDSAVFTLPSRKQQENSKIAVKLCDKSMKIASDSMNLNENSSTGFALGDIMYTNPENLEQTILLQQRLLRQAMIQQAHHLKAQQAFGKGPVPFMNARTDEITRLEWKVSEIFKF